MYSRIVLQCAISALFLVPAASAKTSPGAEMVSVDRPPAFEENRGQFGPTGDFLLEGHGFNFRASTEPVIELYRLERVRLPETGPRDRGEPRPGPRFDTRLTDLVRLQLDFIGADAQASARGLDPVGGKTNYLLGDDRESWHTGIDRFARVRYDELYAGIDVEYRVTDRMPEYVFHIEPGADPAEIEMRFGGAESASLTDAGTLEIEAAGYTFEQLAPVAWQIINGQRRDVPVEYRVHDGRVSFALGDHDPDKGLVIDPVLDFSTYFGGTQSESSLGVHTDAQGNIYTIGVSSSAGLATTGAFEEQNPVLRSEDAFFVFCEDCTDTPPGGNQVERVTTTASALAVVIAKFSADQGQRLWTTYVRTTQADGFFRMGINCTGVTGAGEAAFGLSPVNAGWPLVNEAQSFDDTKSHGYVAKLTDDGSGLVFGSYLQIGADNGFGHLLRGLAVGSAGEVAVSGAVSEENNLPETNPVPGQTCTPNPFGNERSDPFVVLFSTTGAVEFASCLGGDLDFGNEWGRGVDIDATGKLYFLGTSNATDFPVANALQSSPGYPGSRDMVISIIDPSTSPATLEFSTYFGPSAPGGAVDGGFGTHFQAFFPADISADLDGNIAVTGITNEFNFSTVNAFQESLKMPRQSFDIGAFVFPSETSELFVTRIDPAIPEVVFSTFLGGRAGEDSLNTLTVDDTGSVYVSSVTRSADYPAASAIQDSLVGESNLGITKFTPDGKLAWSTFLGGSDDRMKQAPGGIAIDPMTGNVVIAANTSSPDFPLVDPLQGFNAGARDIAIAIIDQSGDVDTDGDGVIDSSDAFPNDPTEWRDTDGDGVGDASDPDIDGDGVDNASDAFPQDPQWSVDADADGIGDSSDLFPANADLAYDFDGDGIGDFADDDTDGDGVPDADDAFPGDPAFTTDTDGDGIPDANDPDNDNDGIPDAEDPAPLDANDPVITFNAFDPFNTEVYKSPLPDGFSIPGGAVAWTAATGAAFSGERSLGSRIIADGETAAVALTDTFAAGTLIFRYKVDSEAGSDVLRFLIDGTEQLVDSGDTGWVEARFPIDAGEHTLAWRFEKDGAGSAGLDAAWIDDIVVQRIGDVSVEIENGVTTVRAGDQTTFDIPVVNTSLNTAGAITLDVPMPPQYSNPVWTCTSVAGGATCPATNGSGALAETFDLPADGALLYRLTVDVQQGPEESVTIGATLSIGSDFIDEVPDNNSAEDADFVGIFGTSFE